jgi:hypothetical protein
MSWKFWKKDDLALPDMNSFSKSELGLKDTSGLDLSAHFEPQTNQFQQFNPAAPAPPPTFQQQSFQPAYPTTSAFSPASQPYQPPAQPDEDHTQQHIQKDLEVIAAKLDTIRAQLDMINTRLANLEREPGPPKRPWY